MNAFPRFPQARMLLWFLLPLYLLPVLGLGVVGVVSTWTGIGPSMFTRDPTAIADVHPFVGVVSNFGVLLWCATAVICLFTWAVSRDENSDATFSKFLLFSGLVTALLLFDDLFLLHENIFPRYLGVPEEVTFGGYAGLIILGGVLFRTDILSTEYPILLVALGFFGLSLGVDALEGSIEQYVGPWRILFEDGFKLLGIVSWFGYFSRCCFIKVARTSRTTQAR